MEFEPCYGPCPENFRSRNRGNLQDSCKKRVWREKRDILAFSYLTFAPSGRLPFETGFMYDILEVPTHRKFKD